MDLKEIIKETENLGVTILFCKIPTLRGRHATTNNKPCIYVNIDLSDTEKINIILHERKHFTNNDINNPLAFVPTFSHRIENDCEESRIINFMSLINHEYPIDDQFNYIQYMESACIPSQYEAFVKETSRRFYKENKDKGII